MRLWLLLSLFCLAGCAGGTHAPWTQEARQSHRWGYYSGPIDTRWTADGRTMILLSELRYTDPNGIVWVAPAGARVDGASIPRAFWSFMGGPFEGRYRAASVLHDVSYDARSRPWQECDRMFYNAMRCSGVSATEAKTMYYALYRFGRHWKFHAQMAEPLVSPEREEPNVNRKTTVEPSDVDVIQRWIRENDPSLGQIESRASAGP
ncbi:MAG TPA: DUF1353 domain-containing protein [Chthoniobacterales bacterium]|nr:DUF1353 domain-containing protein [Chthoniobacterales bacterium]